VESTWAFANVRAVARSSRDFGRFAGARFTLRYFDADAGIAVGDETHDFRVGLGNMEPLAQHLVRIELREIRLQCCVVFMAGADQEAVPRFNAVG
jgi:hypothetical protein